MKIMLNNLLKLSGLILVFSFSVQAQNNLPAKDIEAIKNIKETYRTSWLKNDEKTILSLFSDDATLYPNGNTPVKGKEAMRKFWFAPSDTTTTINQYQITIEDIHGDKDLATMTGSSKLVWTAENRSKQEVKRYVSKNYFITVLVEHNEKWKILKQFWSGKTEEVN